LHLIGLFGGMIWNLGMSFSIIAAGVFIWQEFKDASEGTNKLLIFMFLFYLIGLVLIILARIA